MEITATVSIEGTIEIKDGKVVLVELTDINIDEIAFEGDDTDESGEATDAAWDEAQKVVDGYAWTINEFQYGS